MSDAMRWNGRRVHAFFEPQNIEQGISKGENRLFVRSPTFVIGHSAFDILRFENHNRQPSVNASTQK